MTGNPDIVRVRDVEFPSIEACAEHFGLAVAHAKTMRRLGRLDNLGIGKGRGPRDKNGRMKVSVRGQVFDTTEECAAHFRVSLSCVYSHIAKGTPDKIGIGKGTSNRGRRTGRGRKLTIGPFSFDTLTAASLFLGFSRSYVGNALRGGERASMQRVHERAMVKAAELDAQRREARRWAA